MSRIIAYDNEKLKGGERSLDDKMFLKGDKIMYCGGMVKYEIIQTLERLFRNENRRSF